MCVPRTLRRAGVLGLCVFVLASGALVSPAAGGDSIAEFQFAHETIEAEPGETLELELIVDSDGGYADGIGTLGATIAVNSSVATITGIDHGPWLGDSETASINRSATVSEGLATVRHDRRGGPDDDGVTGEDRFVTVTVEIAEDAPPADVEIEIVEADAILVRGFGLRTIQHASTIAVDGGGETIEPATEPGAENDDGDLDVTTAEDVGRDRTNESTRSDGAGAESGDDTGTASGDDVDPNTEPGTDTEPGNRIPGFTGIAGLLALLTALAALAVRSRTLD
jgi:hypothetical protein